MCHNIRGKERISVSCLTLEHCIAKGELNPYRQSAGKLIYTTQLNCSHYSGLGWPLKGGLLQLLLERGKPPVLPADVQSL